MTRTQSKRSFRFTDLRIRSKLFIGFAVVVVLLLAAGLIGLRQLEEEMRTLIGESTQATARSIVEQLEREVYSRLETVRELALTVPELERSLRRSSREMAAEGDETAIRALLAERDRQWRDWLESPRTASRPAFMAEIESHSLSDKLRRKLRFYSAEAGYAVFSEIFVTDHYGANVAQTSMTSDYLQSDEAWWTNAWNDGLVVGDVRFDDSSQVYSIEFAQRVEASAGESLGVMKAVLDIEDVHRVLTAHEASMADDGGSLTLVDSRGAILYPAFMIPEAPSVTLPSEGFRISTAEDGSLGSKLQATARTVGHGRYPDLGWFLTIAIPRETVFAPILRRRRQLLGAGGIVLVIAIAAAAAISLSITRPIESAVGVADGLAQGDLRLRSVPRTGGEAGRLHSSLESMVANFRRTVESLFTVSHRIRSRAGELSVTGVKISEGVHDQNRAKDGGLKAVAAMTGSMKKVALSYDKVRNEVFETSGAIEQMTASTDVVSRNTTQLARGVEETLRAVRHLATSIDKVAANAVAAGESSDSALADARSGGDVVRRMIDAMTAIHAAIGDTTAVVDRLEAGGQRITQATAIIEDVAKQTRLLALNAAIEAANAGDRGAGFAIVAEEVQRLADRSAASTKEIAALVSDIQHQTQTATRASHQGAEKARQGLELARQVGHALERIVDSAAHLDDSLAGISRSTGEEAGVADELVSTFDEMQERTREVERAIAEQVKGGERIREALQVLTDLAQQVGAAVRVHHQDGQQVDAAMSLIDEITSANAKTADEIVRATVALEHEAKQLRSLADFFHL